MRKLVYLRRFYNVAERGTPGIDNFNLGAVLDAVNEKVSNVSNTINGTTQNIAAINAQIQNAAAQFTKSPSPQQIAQAYQLGGLQSIKTDVPYVPSMTTIVLIVVAGLLLLFALKKK